MRGIVKASRRTPAVRPRDRNGGFPRLSGGVARGSRCRAPPRHALLAEILGKPSLWVIIIEIWYKSYTVRMLLHPGFQRQKLPDLLGHIGFTVSIVVYHAAHVLAVQEPRLHELPMYELVFHHVP